MFPCCLLLNDNRKQLEMSLPGLQAVQPTFMAMYGTQHELSLSYLQDKGLLRIFCPDPGTYRFWKPAQIALLHGQAHDVWFAHPDPQGWKVVGNSTSVQHALVLLGNLMVYTTHLPTGSVKTLFQLFEEHRVCAR